MWINIFVYIKLLVANFYSVSGYVTRQDRSLLQRGILQLDYVLSDSKKGQFESFL